MLLCNLATSDTRKRLKGDIGKVLPHTANEKLITSRQCIQNIWKLAAAGKDAAAHVADHREERFVTCKAEKHPAPPFAMLSRGDLRLVLSAPNPMGGGGQSMPDGTTPASGGWNRFAIEVNDLAGTVERLRKAGVHFRNEIVTGVGGKQVIVEDPSGNPVELFEPVVPEARLNRGH